MTIVVAVTFEAGLVTRDMPTSLASLTKVRLQVKITHEKIQPRPRDYYGREVPPLLMFRQVQLPAAGEGSTSGRREGFTIRTNLMAFNKCGM